METPGQDVLKKPPDELLCPEGHDLLLSLTGILVAECDAAIVHGKDSAVGDGDPMDIPGKIGQHLLGSAYTGLAVDDPLPGPYRPGELHLGQGGSGKFHKPGAKDLGKRRHRYEKTFP